LKVKDSSNRVDVQIQMAKKSSNGKVSFFLTFAGVFFGPQRGLARMLHDHPGEWCGNSSGEEGGPVQAWRGPGMETFHEKTDTVDMANPEKIDVR
jgi:hypothetical protein